MAVIKGSISVLFGLNSHIMLHFAGKMPFNQRFPSTSYTIPDTVTVISDGAFAGCAALTSVNIPSIVTSIGNYTFYNCAMAYFVIPASVMTVGSNAFANCDALMSALFLGEAPPTTVGNGLFDNSDSSFTIWVPDIIAITNYNTVFGSVYSISAVTAVTTDDTFNCGNLQYTVTSGDLKTAAVTGYSWSHKYSMPCIGYMQAIIIATPSCQCQNKNATAINGLWLFQTFFPRSPVNGMQHG